MENVNSNEIRASLPISQMSLERKEKTNLTKHDFNKIGLLGQGSFAKVYLVERNDKNYAMKEVSKDFIIKVR